MAWYDLFSNVYDRSLEALYAPQRLQAAQALRLGAGMTVLDLPCGTGASFPALREGIGAGGAILGIDASAGMLGKARARIDAQGWAEVQLLQRRAEALTREDVDAALGQGARIDRALCFLGLTTFDTWEAGFARTFDLLSPGGRYVIVDVHADPVGLQGRMVQLIARADLRRRVWEPLERASTGFTLERFHAHWQHGGEIVIAAGDKPG